VTRTPYVPDLAGGAEIFGKLEGIDASDAEFMEVRDGAPGDALAALLRLDVGPSGYADDFVGYDVLLMINLTSGPLTDPVLGVDRAGLDDTFAVDLLAGGYLLESPEPLGSLDPFAIWATLIPEGGAMFNAGATGALFRSAAGLANGESAYLKAVPLPGSLGLFVAALAGLNLVQRRKTDADVKQHSL